MSLKIEKKMNIHDSNEVKKKKTEYNGQNIIYFVRAVKGANKHKIEESSKRGAGGAESKS